MRVLRESTALLRRRDVQVGLVIYALTVLATGIRTYSGVASSGGSTLAIASADDRTWYLPVVAAAALAAHGASVYVESRRDEYAWSHGATLSTQFAGQIACGMAGAVACAAIYWLMRVGAASVAPLLADAHSQLTTGDNATRIGVQFGFAGRVSLVAVAAGVLGASAGLAARRPTAAVALAGALFASVLPMLDPLATRFPGIVELQSWLPGGAATTALESNAGVAVSSGLLNLRSGRPAAVGVSLLAAWAAVLLAVAYFRRRSRHSTNTSPSARLLRAVVASAAGVTALAAVLPPMARHALPWYLKPEWLHDVRSGSSSIDAVESIVDSLRRGESLAEAVDPTDPFWRPLRKGDVDVASESEMEAPDVVTVTAREGADPRRGYIYVFQLDRDDDGWEILRVRVQRKLQS
ncbi:MAG: hypothetical protein KatS3mg008_1732 [Acidimicrobiales bacterium]|nr:MAG: hypothetical protein KatS3mg008_1732 [Acidimicrobiales bacterium]